MAEAGGRFAQPHGNQLRLGRSIEQLRRRRGLPFLANQRRLEAFENERLPHILDRLPPAPYCLADLGVIPSLPVRVRLKQDRRPPKFLRLSLLLLDGRFANRPFPVREPDEIHLLHRNLLVAAEVPKNRRYEQSQNLVWTGH
jgi:hypothetical protein